MKQKLFREAALRDHERPEHLGDTLRLTPCKTWIGLAVAGILVLGALAWAIWGAIPRTVGGIGILTTEGRTRHVVANGPGIVEYHEDWQLGDRIQKGQLVGSIHRPVLSSEVDSHRELLALFEEETEWIREQIDRERVEAEASRAAAANSHRRRVQSLDGQLEFFRERMEELRGLAADGLLSQEDLQASEARIARLENERLDALSRIEELSAAREREESGLRARLRRLRFETAEARRKLDVLERRLTTESEIRALRGGRIIDINSLDGTQVAVGQNLMTTAEDSEAGEAVVFIPHTGLSKRVKPGMEARISPDAYRKERYGYLLGTVESVSPYPIDRDSMIARVGSEALADEILGDGVPFAVTARLREDPSSPNGYAWSSAAGGEAEVSMGSTCTASFVVDRPAPISLVIPALRELLGQ
ncbi:MAG: NHLP bacteriocin system secretion protein [Puniceicoccaceae bacterium]